MIASVCERFAQNTTKDTHDELYLLSRWPSLHGDTQINTLLKQILLDALNKKISSKARTE